MAHIDLPNKFLRVLYKFLDEHDLEVKDDDIWKLANNLAVVADKKYLIIKEKDQSSENNS